MDEYLSEKEQIEAIRQWWRENGWFLVGGAAIAGLGYFGYNQYQAYRNTRAEEAAALYVELQQTIEDDRPGADDLLAQLSAEYASSPYTDHARMLVASESLISDPPRAVEELRTVMETSPDPGLAMVARVRLGRVLAYQERYDEAIAVLTVDDPGNFTARINEILGDIHAAVGDVAAARRAYTVALTAPGADMLDANFLQMKLGDLAVPAPPPLLNEAPASEAPVEAETPAATSTPAASPAEAAPAEDAPGQGADAAPTESGEEGL